MCSSGVERLLDTQEVHWFKSSHIDHGQVEHSRELTSIDSSIGMNVSL